MIRNAYWKLQRRPFFWQRFVLFKQHYIFLYIIIFIWEVRITCFPNCLRIIINTKFLKVLQFGVFIQISNRFRCHLNLKMSLRFFWLTCLIFEMRSDHYLLAKVLIKMGFLIFPRKMFVYLKLKKIFFQRLHGFS